MIKSSTAVLAVHNVTQTIAFYVDVLGFKQRWLWGNPPTFGCIGMGDAEIFVCQQPDLAQKIEGHMHYFAADDLDALHDLHCSKNAPIIHPLQNKPWGIREYTVRDINGYHLRFSGPLKYEKPATGVDALPAHIRIDVALPDLEVYKSLFGSVEWNVHEPSMREALARSMFGVLAIDARDGQTVGMVRVTGDGRYFMIWDVIVRPSQQGQKFGQAMMERALAELRRRRVHEGAFVGLFTGKPEFYQRVGFKRDGGMHLAL